MFHRLLRIPSLPKVIRSSYLLHNNNRHIVCSNVNRFYCKGKNSCPEDGNKKCVPGSRMDTVPKPSCPWNERQEQENKKNNRTLILGILVAAVSLAALLYNMEFTKPDKVQEKKKKVIAGYTRSRPKCRIPAADKIPKKVPYLLVGGGTASFSAFRAIKSSDPTAKVLVISNECYYPYMRPPLSKEVWYNADDKNVDKLIFKQWNGTERSLFYEPDDFYTDPENLLSNPNGGVSIVMGYDVTRIDVVDKKAYLDNGTAISYDKCLIATGAAPKNLDVFEAASSEIQDKVTLFRDIFDYQHLNDICKNSKSIAIIGGGFLGSELACSLGKLGEEKGFKVSQIFKESGNMGKVLPEYLSEWTTKKVKQENVNIISKSLVEDVTIEDKRLLLHLNNGSKLTVDHVIIAIGVKPNSQLAKTSDLEIDPDYGGYLVNAEMEARSNLYAAGDCSCFYDIKLGRRRVEHHDHAVVTGRLAGENMTGAMKPYVHQSMFWSDLGPNIGYEAIGRVDASLPTVAVFAKAGKKDTPKAAVTASNTNLRSETQELPNKTPEKLKIQEVEKRPDKKDVSNEEYGKGVIFYLKDDCVVGILLWNVFNRMSIARQVLQDERKYDDLNEVAKLFNIHDE